MSTLRSKRRHKSLGQTVHHCQLILSYWCRSLQLDIIKISYINSTICQTILAYRGPGDIVAFSTNGRLSSIEIYNIDSIDLSAINVCINYLPFDFMYRKFASY